MTKATTKKILIVEDNLINQRVLQGIIRHLGHNFIAVLDGKEAFAIAKREKPDLVILDIQLVDISGVEIAQLIREDKDLCDVPIIVSTSFVSQEQKEELIHKTKCNEFMPKPIDPPTLVKMIGKYVNVQPVEWK